MNMRSDLMNKHKSYALYIHFYNPFETEYTASCPVCKTLFTEKDAQKISGGRFLSFDCPKCKSLLYFPSSNMKIDENTNEILDIKE